MDEGGLLSVPEVAQRFNVDESTVRRLLYRGEFPAAFKAGRDWKIPKADVEAYVEKQRRARQVAASVAET